MRGINKAKFYIQTEDVKYLVKSALTLLIFMYDQHQTSESSQINLTVQIIKLKLIFLLIICLGVNISSVSAGVMCHINSFLFRKPWATLAS